MTSDKQEIKRKIVALLEDAEKPVSKRYIARLMKLSPATASKYVDILDAEGILDVMDYGNINLVTLAVNTVTSSLDTAEVLGIGKGKGNG